MPEPTTTNEDGTLHAATITALKERGEMYEPGQRGPLERAVEWIEQYPDAFWDRFAGPMLDKIEELCS